MKVLIPTSLRKFADGRSELTVEANTVDEALCELVAVCPELKAQLFDEDGSLVSYVNFFVNDENIRDLNDRDSEVRERDELVLVPALAGG